MTMLRFLLDTASAITVEGRRPRFFFSSEGWLAGRCWMGMNPLRSAAYLILMAALPMVALAQDGWLFSATPPIVVRFDGNEATLYFTNTSDAPIHGVTLHNGQEHRVIIDTIEPHKTASVNLAILTGLIVARETAVTCANYSKPLKVDLSN
jgi:hypothetical protein